MRIFKYTTSDVYRLDVYDAPYVYVCVAALAEIRTRIIEYK